MTRPSTGQALLASLCGGAIAVAFTFIVRDLFHTPLIAELVVDATTQVLQPKGFSYFISNLGPSGKPLLFLSIVLAELLSFAIVWNFGGRLFGAAGGKQALFAAGAIWLLRMFATISLVALTEARLDDLQSFALVNAGACVLYGGVAWILVQTPDDGAMRSDARRAFLLRVPLALLGGGAVFVLLRRLSGSVGGGAQVTYTGRETPEVTSNEDFYLVSKNLIDPNPNGSKWRLRVGGVTNQMLELTYEDIVAFPASEQYTTLQCISNEVGGSLISNALWKGISLRDLLARVEPLPTATHVMFRSDDDYTESLPLDFAMSNGVMLAHTMNGERLPQKHGFPLRLLAPGKYGMNQPKWITEIVLVDKDMLGYWGRRGWSPSAPMNTSCRIDVPAPDREVVGPVTVRGVAFSGDRGVSKVELSVDGGKTWRETILKPALSPYTWVLWHYDWTDLGSERRVLLQARATDGRGELQSAIERPPYPSGATGNPRVEVQVKTPA